MRRTPKTLLPAAAAIALTLAAALAAAPALISPNLGGGTTRAIDGKTAFTFPAANIRAEHQRDFFFGNRLFNTNWVIAPASVKSFDGLGPFFNRVSCSGCHTQDGRGRPPETGAPMESMLLRLSVPDAAFPGEAGPHPVYGDQISDRANPGIPAEGAPKVSYETWTGLYADGTKYGLLKPSYSVDALAYGPLGQGAMLSPRVAQQVIGLGLLEAVPEAALAAMADPDDVDGDGVSGRMNYVADVSSSNGLRVGRFGWKANQPDLPAQNAAAAKGDIGLTNPLHRRENCAPAQAACLAAPKAPEIDLSEKFFDKLNLYTRLLAVPAQRRPDDPQVQKGGALFAKFGCSACHIPTLRTGTHTVLPELENQTFHPFTDLLLHDMGGALADNRPDGGASGYEWRTPPLWGLGLVPAVNGHNRLLHDGRARGFAEAILWHGGEAEASRHAFSQAEKADRDALLAFLGSL